MDASQSRTTTEPVVTQNYKRIQGFLNGVQRRGQFAFLFGSTGYGKSFAARKWTEESPDNAAYVRARTGSTQVRLRKQISEAVFGSENMRERDIITHIKEHPGFVLVVDECNHLLMDSNLASAKCLDSIRDIFDEVNELGGRCGVCFIFTDYTMEYLSKCRIASFLQQFIKRADNQLKLTGRNFWKNEIEPTVRYYEPDASEELLNYTKKYNDVRSVHKRFLAAKSIWPGKAITVEMINELQIQLDSGERDDK